MEANGSATTEEFEAKTKDFESVSHRVFQSAYSAGGDAGAGAGMGGMGGMGSEMPGGMPDLNNMDMNKMKEFFDKLPKDQRDHIEQMAKAQMESQNASTNADGPKGYDGSEVNEID